MPLKEVSAYLLSNIAGNEHPTVADVEKILKSVGAHFDHASVEKLVAELKGKSLHEVIAAGRTKLFSAVVCAAPAASPAAGASKASPKKGAAAKKEEPKEEEEEAAFSLFD
jgi:large subunit ribosomal protein LP2